MQKQAREEKALKTTLISTKCRESQQFSAFTDQNFTKIKSQHVNSIIISKIQSKTPTISLKNNYNFIQPIQIQQKCLTAQNNVEPLDIISLKVKGKYLEKRKMKNIQRKSYLRLADNSSKNERTETKPIDQIQKVVDQQNKEKIMLLKKIIEHYNIRSIEKTYYSNLMSNSAVKTNQEASTTKFVTIKKVLPREIGMRNDFVKTSKNVHGALFKIKDKFNHSYLTSIDTYDNLYQKNNLSIEAKGLKQKIHAFKKNSKSIQGTPDGIRKNQKPTSRKLFTKSSANNHSSSKISKNIQGYYDNNYMDTKFKSINLCNHENSTNIKVNKYREFLFMINFSNNVYRQLDIDKYDQSFKVYIGKGNNSNLIRSILKKRFWIEITKDIQEANFVWTQLKEQSIFLKQASNQISQEQQNEGEQAIEILQEMIILEKEQAEQPQNKRKCSQKQESSTQLYKSQIRAYRYKKQEKTISVRFKALQNQNPQSKILTRNQCVNYYQLLETIPTKKKYLFSDRVRYLGSKFKTILSNRYSSTIIHNHLPCNGLLGNKKAMFYMLRQYCRLQNKDIFQIVPLTFHIRKGFLDDQFKQFMKVFVQNRTKNIKNYWIIKPGEFSNRGQGISCSSKIQEIKSRISQCRAEGKNRSLILQRYITNPLLYNQRKFDIRTYMLVTINNGKLRSYWYQDGYIRTSSFIWNLQEMADSYIHLTNDAVQKNCQQYGKYQPGNKLTYSELQRYLDHQKHNGRRLNFQSEIYPKLKQMATDAIKSSFYFLDRIRKANNFEIFGFDFMIDINFKPWLIEINTNPCLELNCPVLERIIPSMVENAFRIAVDPILPPPINFSSTYKYSIPENALYYNKFQLIFDEEKDGSLLMDLYRNNNIVETMDDIEQEKQTYEEDGIEIDLENI